MDILTYDPAANSARLRRHLGLGLVRAWRIAWLFCRFFVMRWASARRWLPHRTSEAERELACARFLARGLVELGPTFIKVGQALSTRPDLLPLPYVKELARLQDRVPAFDTSIALATIERELGQPIAELFAEFDTEPISAASIGQVYGAVTFAGHRVVVKVQRPNLPFILSIDLAILRQIARGVVALVTLQKRLRQAGWGRQGQKPARDSLAWRGALFAKDMPYVAIVDQFGRSLFDQTDFVGEGHNADRFRANFAGFENVRSPIVYWDYTTRYVITLERIEGVKFNDVAGIEKMGVDFHDIVHLGVRAFIKQLLEDGFFHADTHPGNILVTENAEVVYIDWGMTDTLARDEQLKLVDIFLHMMRAQYDLVAEDLVEIEMFPPDVDRAMLVPVLADVYESQLGKHGQIMGMNEILDRIGDVLYRYPFRLPERFSFLMRSVGTMEGVVLETWPTFRFLDVGMPYAAKLLLTVADPRIRSRLVEDLVKDGRLDTQQLAQTLELASLEQTFDFVEFLPAGLDWLLSEEGEPLRAAVGVSLREGDPELLAQIEAMLAMEPDRLRSILDDLLAALGPMLARHGRQMQEIFDWTAYYLSTASGRRLAAELAGAVSATSNASWILEMTDLGELALSAGIDLKPLTQAIVSMMLSPEGEAWRDLAVEVALGGEGSGRMLGFLLALVFRDGVGLDLMAGAAGATWLAVSPRGRSMRRKAIDVLRRRILRWP